MSTKQIRKAWMLESWKSSSFKAIHSNKYEVISHFGFELLYWLVMLSVFLYIIWPFVCLLWRNIYSSPYPFFNWVLKELLSCRNFLYILHINSLSDIEFASIFSHSIDYLFTLLIVSSLSFIPRPTFISLY